MDESYFMLLYLKNCNIEINPTLIWNEVTNQPLWNARYKNQFCTIESCRKERKTDYAN